MPTSNSDFHIGHRERLRQKFLDGKIADYEILELLLAYAIPRRDVRPIARGLLKRFGNVYNVINAPIDELTSYPGMGRSSAIMLGLVKNIMLLAFKNKIMDRPVFYDAQLLNGYCMTMMSGKSVEEFHVLYLDNEYRLISDEMHSIGTINEAPVYGREIAKRALALNSRHVVLVHNHPVSDNTFSVADTVATHELQQFLKMLDIELFDHILVANGNVYSAKNMSLLH